MPLLGFTPSRVKQFLARVKLEFGHRLVGEWPPDEP